jgi:hypothetical protein
VLERLVSWTELEQMDIDDVDLLNLALDEWQAAERAANAPKD